MRWDEMRWRLDLQNVYVSVVMSSNLELVSLERRPDLVDAFWEVQGTWPVFIEQDPVSKQNYVAAVEAFPNLHLIALRNGTPIARVHAVPITWPGSDDLPDSGWDWALGQALDHGGDAVTAVSLIEIRIIPSMRGQGLSHVVLAGVREQLIGLGTRDLVGPVRPNGKAHEPRTPISEYAFRQRSDGLPFDDWLRVHVRAGGRIVKPAPLSMTIPGSLTQWRDWTGMAFDTAGSVDLDGALAPVHVDLANEHAVYVEPNVWVHHQLSPR